MPSDELCTDSYQATANDASCKPALPLSTNSAETFESEHEYDKEDGAAKRRKVRQIVVVRAPTQRRWSSAVLCVIALLLAAAAAVGIWSLVRSSTGGGGKRAAVPRAITVPRNPLGDMTYTHPSSCLHLLNITRVSPGDGLFVQRLQGQHAALGASWDVVAATGAVPSASVWNASNAAAATNGIDGADLIYSDDSRIVIVGGQELVIVHPHAANVSASVADVVARVPLASHDGFVGRWAFPTNKVDGADVFQYKFGLAYTFEARKVVVSGHTLVVVGTAQQAEPLESSVRDANGYGMIDHRFFPTIVLQVWSIANESMPQLQAVTEMEGDLISVVIADGILNVAVSAAPHWAPSPLNTTANSSAHANNTFGFDAPSSASVMPFMRTIAIDAGETEEGAVFFPVCDCANVGFIPNMVQRSFVTIASVAMTADHYAVDTTDGVSQQNSGASWQQWREIGEIVNIITTSGSWRRGHTPVVIAGNSLYLITPQDRDDIAWYKEGQGTKQEGTAVVKYVLYHGLVILNQLGQVPGVMLNAHAVSQQNNLLRIITHVYDAASNGFLSLLSIASGQTLESLSNVTLLASDEPIALMQFADNGVYISTSADADARLLFADLSDYWHPKAPVELQALRGFQVGYAYATTSNQLLLFGNMAHSDGGTDSAIALLDTTPSAQPTLLHLEVIGSFGSDIEVLKDANALLYQQLSDTNALLYVPARQYYGNAFCMGQMGQPGSSVAFEGMLVYRMQASTCRSCLYGPCPGCFVLESRIAHVDPSQYPFLNTSSWCACGAAGIKRVAVQRDVAYSVSAAALHATSLSDIIDSSFGGHPLSTWQTPLLQTITPPSPSNTSFNASLNASQHDVMQRFESYMLDTCYVLV